MLWGGYVSFVQGPFSSTEATLVDFFARGISFPVSLLAAGWMAYRVPKAQRWRSPWVAGALFLVGGAMLLVQSLLDIRLSAAALVSGTCFGLGSGIIFCSLQQLVAAQKVYTAGIIVFTAAGLSAAVFFIIYALPQAAIPWIAFLVLMPSTIGVLLLARREEAPAHPMFETVPRQRHDRLREAVAELWRPLLCIAFSAFIVGLIRIDSLSDGSLLHQINASNMLGLFVASLVLLGTWKFVYERIGLTKIYQVLFPLTATAFLLLPLFEGAFRNLFVSFEFLVFSITSSLMVITCARTARSQSLHPVLVYGLFGGIVYAFSVVGALVGYVLDSMQGESFMPLLVIALAAIYALSLAMTLQRRRNKEKAISGTGSGAGESVGEQKTDASFEVRCVAIVERYGLSKREAEVLSMLARGRDVPYIAEELVVSKNTVRSHTKNIFVKTGVHSRQELIDLVERSEQ